MFGTYLRLAWIMEGGRLTCRWVRVDADAHVRPAVSQRSAA